MGPVDIFTSINGEYFGQTLSGLQATRFAAGEFLSNSEWFWHGSPVFSPDGKEVYFGKYLSTNEIKIYFSEMNDGRWTMPQNISFAMEEGTNNPVFSAGGDTLYFIRHLPGGFIYQVTRNGSGWSTPEVLDIPIPQGTGTGWQFARTNDGKIYFELWEDNGSTPPDIYVTSSVNGVYTAPERLSDSINTAYNEFAPCIHPNDEYIMFVSNRPGGYGMHDIYISFHNSDGSWTEAKNVGSSINTDWDDPAPGLSPDCNYIFFTTVKSGDNGYNPYWISSQVIEDLRPD